MRLSRRISDGPEHTSFFDPACLQQLLRAPFTQIGIGTVLICPALPRRSAMTQCSSRSCTDSQFKPSNFRLIGSDPNRLGLGLQMLDNVVTLAETPMRTKFSRFPQSIYVARGSHRRNVKRCGFRHTASVIVIRRVTTKSGCTYCPSSRSSRTSLTPEIVPVNSPVAAKKTGLLRASVNALTTVSVIVRTPDASLKRPVPPVI